MSLFRPKISIHLSPDELDTSQHPPEFTRKSSKWYIPCCRHISLGKSGGKIRLPDDSDSDSTDEDHNQPNSSISLSHAYNEGGQNENLPNIFSQAQTRSQTSLSRNPFARALSNVRERSIPDSRHIFATEEEFQVDGVKPKISGEDELVDFTRSPFSRYEDEPDWTETYKDNEDDHYSTKSIKTGFQISNNEEYGYESDSDDKDDDAKSDSSKDATHTQANTILYNHTNDTSVTILSNGEKKQGDKIPQIEEVLHMLPLSEISGEIPPALMYKKPSFKNSMHGEEPLMPEQNSTDSSRFSRFSTTEEDYLSLKKREEQEKKGLSLKMINTSAETSENKRKNNPPGTTDIDLQEQRIGAAAATDDTRTSIAQSILGDRLDDFTEKLAFIKKNIIMSVVDSDDEEEGISAEKILKKVDEVKSRSAITNATSSQEIPPKLHRRTSSFLDAVPKIARFMNQIGGGSITADASTSSSSQPSLSPTSFSPSSLFSALAGPMPEAPSSPTISKKLITKRSIPEEEEADQEDEELFDFAKVLEIGKNVKTFGEGVVGNGIRMFNDVATRVKTTVEEEQKRAVRRTESSSTSSSANNENEWMHNYL
ncbi:hypothetical protein [Parasitella parasitica]|uniref:Uncharacterized protein n=1 Tax=Parasitella parasitica TaxID=35722 RepID=A0A0B7NJ95_9FUNG|nr:hypothetical protein [Parasitella parasitica]